MKKAAPKKAAPKKAVAKKPAPKKAVAKKPAPAKKAVAKKPAATKKAVAKKPAAAKKVVAKKPAPAKKVVVKKAAPVKAVAPKAAPSKTVASSKKEIKTKAAPVKAIPAAPAAKTVSKPVAPAPAPKPVKKAGREKAKKTIVSEPVPARSSNPFLPAHKPAYNTTERKPEVQTPKVITSQRYSDADLAEFKALILRKLEDAREELVNLQSQIINANENGTDDTGASFKMLEDGSDTLAKEEAANLAVRQKKFIEQLEAALIRIENKTYGICRVTGKLIPKERLRAVPHTTQSMEAKMQQYKD